MPSAALTASTFSVPTLKRKTRTAATSEIAIDAYWMLDHSGTESVERANRLVGDRPEHRVEGEPHGEVQDDASDRGPDCRESVAERAIVAEPLDPRRPQEDEQEARDERDPDGDHRSEKAREERRE